MTAPNPGASPPVVIDHGKGLRIMNNDHVVVQVVSN